MLQTGKLSLNILEPKIDVPLKNILFFNEHFSSVIKIGVSLGASVWRPVLFFS